MKRYLKKIFGRRFRMGSYSAFAIVFVIAIAVIANMVAGSLPSTLTQLDLTANQMFTLSEQTKRICSSLGKDVNLYLIATSGGEDDSVTRLLDRYAALYDHIKVQYVDPSLQPTFLSSHDLEKSSLYANSVLVESDTHSRLVGYDEIFVTTYDYDSYSYNYTSTTVFDGENALTNAIHYVSSDNLPKVYTLYGHGERELNESIESLLEQDNMELDEVSLLSIEEMPEDASCLIIQYPTSDLGDEEADLLISWLENGGRIILITSPFETAEMPNLLRVTQSMGMTAKDGLVVEGSSNNYLSRYPYYLLPNIKSHTITDALISGRYYVFMPLAHAIEKYSGTSASVSYLLSTSSSAYLKAEGLNTETIEKEDGDEEGTYYLGAASTLGDAMMCWFSGSDMLESSIDRSVSGANSNLFMNAVNWMCDQEETISIRSKSLDQTGLTITSAQRSFWTGILLVAVPLFFIAVGICVVVRRKRR